MEVESKKSLFSCTFFLSLFPSQFSLLFTLFGDAAGHFWFIVLIALVSLAGAAVDILLLQKEWSIKYIFKNVKIL